ncbi:MAG: hypothetical protein NC402_02995 [Prevotella sp.]|nr:hypothetical protein [Prevotella sp.]MCM1074767.1 hypothetical protein [Ruminococcus sp.]
MKKVIYISTILLCMTLFSCKNSKQSADKDDTEPFVTETETDLDDDTDNSLTLVPIIEEGLTLVNVGDTYKSLC